MNIEGIGKELLINNNIEARTFPFSIVYEGDLIYEVVRIYNGYPLFWKEHLDRMENSLILHGQAGKLIVDEIEASIRHFIKKSELKNNNIKIIIGNFKEKTYDFMAYHMPTYYPDEAFYKNGAKVVTFRHERKNPNAKIINHVLTDRVMALRQENNAYEVALVNEAGVITEGSRSNLFFLKGHCVYVSEGHKILKGITMLKVMTLFKALAIEYIEEDVYQNDLGDYDACFMTSTSNNILPIDRIDEWRFDSSHHPVVIALMKAFERLIREDEQAYIRNYEEAF